MSIFSSYVLVSTAHQIDCAADAIRRIAVPFESVCAESRLPSYKAQMCAFATPPTGGWFTVYRLELDALDVKAVMDALDNGALSHHRLWVKTPDGLHLKDALAERLDQVLGVLEARKSLRPSSLSFEDTLV